MTEKEPQVEPTQEMPENDPQQEPKQEPTLEELSNRLKEFEAQLKTKDKEIAGLNKRNSLLENEQKELERAKMSEEEKAKAELAELEAEKEAAKRERDEAKRQILVDKLLSDAGLPLDFAKRVTGETAEEIQADIQDLSSFFSNKVKEVSETEIKKALGGPAPEGGKPPEGRLSIEEIAKIPDREKRVKLLKENGYDF